jgi:peroxiredoxin
VLRRALPVVVPVRTHRRRLRDVRRVGSATLAVTLGAALLGGCASGSGNASGGGDLGYVPGDGSIKTWAAGDRGKPVELTGTDFEGKKVDTADDRGDVVVVNTWYASCAPCRKEAPDLTATAKANSDGVDFVGINSTDDAGSAEAFQRTFDIPYPSIADKDGSVIATLQGVVPVQAVPTTVVLDQQGRVAARVLGSTTKDTLQGLIDDVRASGTPTP